MMKINIITGMPEQVARNASEKLNIRITPERKSTIRHLANNQKKSMSKILIRMIDFYLHHTVGIENSNPELL
jgi:hypothetical protein